jgi:hypothetical protein
MIPWHSESQENGTRSIGGQVTYHAEPGFYRKVTTFLFVNSAPAHIIERGSIRDPGPMRNGPMRNGAREKVPAEMMLQGEKQ